jgi:hypothetical protein
MPACCGPVMPRCAPRIALSAEDGPPSEVRMCETELLIEQRGVRVERCRCGVVHVRLGSISLHLSAERLSAMADVLGTALRELDAVLHLEAAERELAGLQRRRLSVVEEVVEA